MTGPETARAEDVWHRSYPLWEAYFALVLAATITATALDEVAPQRRAAAIALLVLLGLAYAATGREGLRAEGDRRPRCLMFAVAAVLMFVPVTLLAPVSAMSLAALAPMIYMIYGTSRGLALLTALMSGPAGLLALSGAGVVLTAVTMTVVLACSALLAVFIERLGRQNRERARLIEDLDRTRSELAELSREAGVLAERERLARDIHDTIAQGFTGIAMLLQAAEADVGPNRYLELAARTAKENLAETRGLVAAMAPPALEGNSLAGALERLARDFELPVELRVDGEPGSPSPAEVVLLRVAQESFANVRRHAGAESVRLSLEYGGTERDGMVRLVVADDGRGFDPGAVGSGFGLRGMRSRVEQAGGTLAVRSAPGRGAEITVEVPCSAS